VQVGADGGGAGGGGDGGLRGAEVVDGGQVDVDRVGLGDLDAVAMHARVRIGPGDRVESSGAAASEIGSAVMVPPVDGILRPVFPP
jgi:hypothetical protein